MTAAFSVLTDHLFNEESNYCVIPKYLRKYEKLIDDDNDGHITPEEVENATRILEKVKKRERRRNHLRQLEGNEDYHILRRKKYTLPSSARWHVRPSTHSAFHQY